MAHTIPLAMVGQGNKTHKRLSQNKVLPLWTDKLVKEGEEVRGKLMLTLKERIKCWFTRTFITRNCWMPKGDVSFTSTWNDEEEKGKEDNTNG